MRRGSIAAVVAILAFWMVARAQQDLKSLVYQAPPDGYSGLEGRVRLYDRSHAVVIGISKYKSLPELGTCQRF